MADLIKALELIHNPSSTNALRREALTYVESQKESKGAARNGFILASHTENAPLVRYFGLTLLDHVLRHTSITSHQLGDLRELVLKLAQSIRPRILRIFATRFHSYGQKSQNGHGPWIGLIWIKRFSSSGMPVWCTRSLSCPSWRRCQRISSTAKTPFRPYGAQISTVHLSRFSLPCRYSKRSTLSGIIMLRSGVEQKAGCPGHASFWGTALIMCKHLSRPKMPP